jgi:hypothetical protein
MPTHATGADLRWLRLRAQQITGSGAATIREAAQRMLAVQAQDFASASWALGVRTPGSTHTDVLDALARGEIVRSWPMRGTLHFVAAEDLGWMLSVSTERMLNSLTTRNRQLDLDERAFAEARALVEKTLAGGGSIGRDELMKLFEANGIRTAGQRGYHLIYYLAQTGVVCWGPPLKNQQALVLSTEWITNARTLERDEALAEFALRYFRGHGPATERDLAWWAKLTLTDARAGIALARRDLEELSADDTTFWIARDTAAVETSIGARSPRGVKALPGFDEYVLGYQRRQDVLPTEFAGRVAPGSNGIFLPTIDARGRIAGTWRRTIASGTVSVRPDPFVPLSASESAQFVRAVDRYAQFLGLGAVVA